MKSNYLISSSNNNYEREISRELTDIQYDYDKERDKTE